MDELHPFVHQHTHKERERIRQARSKGQPANFSNSDYVMVEREDLFEGEKLCIRWRGPRRVIEALRDYISRLEYLRTEDCDDIHDTRLKFYQDNDLDEKFILSHVLSSETGMQVARLPRLVDQDGELFVAVRWEDLSTSDDTLEPLRHVYKDVPKLTKEMLNRKSTPATLRTQAYAALGL